MTIESELRGLESELGEEISRSAMRERSRGYGVIEARQRAIFLMRQGLAADVVKHMSDHSVEGVIAWKKAMTRLLILENKVAK